jgi:dual specificity phosphatase 12
MGRSRSVTLLTAFLLRQYPHHTPQSALSLIQQSRPFAEPNDGFISQLLLYHEMGCPRNIDEQPRYQRWLYQREVDLAVAAGSRPDWVRFEDEVVQEEEIRQMGEKEKEKEKEIRCRMCRYVTGSSSLSHNCIITCRFALSLSPYINPSI